MSSPDFFGVIKYPLMTEKAVNQLERYGKLTFIVRGEANKKVIKEAVERYFEVKVRKENILISPKGEKKAIITFESVEDARRIAMSLGLL